MNVAILGNPGSGKSTLASLELRRGIHAALGGIALSNEGSFARHDKFGMRKAARCREVGARVRSLRGCRVPAPHASDG